MESEIFEVISRSMDTVLNIEAVEASMSLFDDKPHGMRGSGFVIDDQGYIITNSHVVSKYPEIKVIHKNEILDGQLVNSCPFMDLALIKVDEKLPVAELGDSSKIRIGQRVYLIGNPFGLRGTPTVGTGIISGIKRSIRISDLFLLDLIQTDAHLNPGNSGGPLIDIYGKVLGVTTATIAMGLGIGFSIPINIVKEFVKQVLTKGRYSIPDIGIDGFTITPGLNRLYKLGSDYGVLITSIFEGGPAEMAGLADTSLIDRIFPGEFPPKKYGSIISYDGQRVEGFEEFLRMVRTSQVGSKVKLGLIKRGESSEVEVEIGERS
jgi:serine protease Do